MISHLFEKDDRVSRFVINTTTVCEIRSEQTRVDRKYQSWLETNCQRWTSDAIGVLDQLNQDVNLAQTITWDRNILKDAVARMDFLTDYCVGVWDELGAACQNRPNTPLPVREGSAKCHGDLARNPESSGSKATGDLVTLNVMKALNEEDFKLIEKLKIPCHWQAGRLARRFHNSLPVRSLT